MSDEDDTRAAYEKIEALLKAGRRLTVRQATDELRYSDWHVREAFRWLTEKGRAHRAPGSDPHECTI